MNSPGKHGPSEGSPIAWIGDPWAGTGRWGLPGELAVPLDDRGLLLADGLFETLRVEGGRALLLTEHLQRWLRTGNLLGLAGPPPLPRLESLISQAVARSGAEAGALRLNMSRGGGGRGLDPPTPAMVASDAHARGGRFWLTYTPGPAQFTPVQLVLSRLESRNPTSLLSRCKTFAYGSAIQARREAHRRGADDALLLGTSGELCCGTASSLLVRRRDGWLTPPLSSGALPGVMRGRALALGLAQERSLSAAELTAAPAALLINSLGCRPIRRFEDTDLPGLSPAQAEAFWRALNAPDRQDQMQPCTEMR
jgi:branched-subunit amino acid aminotransferase/4-amino-4-deoxychorismate lyase